MTRRTVSGRGANATSVAPPAVGCGRGVTAGLLLLLAMALVPTASAAIWPLTKYESCSLSSLRAAIPDAPAMAASGGISIAPDDEDVLWTTLGDRVYKLQRSSMSVLSVFQLKPGGSRRRHLLQDPSTSLSIAAMRFGRVAITDGKERKITVIGGDDKLEVEREIDVSFVPAAVTVDEAYEVFYAANAETKDGAAPGAQISEINMADGTSRALFEFDSDFLGFVRATSIHYASNTGTLFVLCNSCPGIVEVTLSGRLRSTSSSYRDLDNTGEELSLTISRDGSPLLLLKKSVEIEELCQDIPPSLPVLPPPRAAIIPPQTWYPLENYVFCGASRFEEAGSGAFESIILDASLRTVWAYFEGTIREYNMRGQRLRVISAAQLEDLGIFGITSMAWVKRNKILVGMKGTNRVAIIDTAPPSAKSQILAVFKEQEGLTDDDEIEPPGQDVEDAIIRTINLVEVDIIRSIGTDLIPAQTLESVSYSPLSESVLFTSTSTGASVYELVVSEDSKGTILLDGAAIDTKAVDGLLYSPLQDRFLLWENFGAELFMANRESEDLNSTRTYDFFITTPGQPSSASSFAMTPDGALLLIADVNGEVNFQCGSDQPGSDAIADRARSGEDPDVDPEYFWQLQQLTKDEAEATGETRSTGDVSFYTRFGIECTDPVNYYVFPQPVAERGICEVTCEGDANCNAYTYDFTSRSCVLKFSCNSPVVNLRKVSGTKMVVEPPSPPPTAPPPPPVPPLPPGVKFLEFPGFACPASSSTLLDLSGVTVDLCRYQCGIISNCAAFTFSSSLAKCSLKTICQPSQSSGSYTGVRDSAAPAPSSPPPPVVRPSPPPPPVAGPSPSPRPPPPPPPPAVAFTITPGIGCKDTTLETIRNFDLEKCKEQCAKNSACKAFTLNTITMSCFLKRTCSDAQPDTEDITGVATGTQITVPEPQVPISSGSLEGGWTYRSGQDCTPWGNKKCGLGDAPGLKIGDITWYRMFAHEGNPLRDDGNGVMYWTPYREREPYGAMYYKGSEIIGYFDTPWKLSAVNDQAVVTFLWMTEGEVQKDICGDGLGDRMDCEKCGKDYDKKTGERYIYHEVRCYSGTGDFRVGLLDSSRGQRITKDGYGYFNDVVTQYRGLQWRFHPQACPKEARSKPFGYAAVGASSWVRDECCRNDGLNFKSLILDYVEKGKDGWNSGLGESRSFKSRLFDPAENGACLNLENGKFTPESKPFRMTVKIVSKTSSKTRFLWKMEFNGWNMEQVDEWDTADVPNQIDSIVVGYTNSRSFTKLKLKHISP